MSSSLNYDKIEYFDSHGQTTQTPAQQKATMAVDHCKLRPIKDIKSSMCKPSPIKTSKCIKPAVSISSKKCVLYRYENPKTILFKLRTNGFYIFKNMISDTTLSNDTLNKNSNNLMNTLINPEILDKINDEIKDDLVAFQFGTIIDQNNSNNSNSNNSKKNNSYDSGYIFRRDIQNYSSHRLPDIFSIFIFPDGGKIDLIPGSNNTPRMNINDAYQKWIKKISINLDSNDVIILNSSLIYGIPNNINLLHISPCVFKHNLEFIKKTLLFTSYDSNSWIPILKNSMNSIINTINTKLYYLNSAIGYSKLGLALFTSDKNILFVINPYNHKDYILVESKIDGIKKIKSEYTGSLIFLTHSLNFMVLYLFIIIALVILIIIIKMIATN